MEFSSHVTSIHVHSYSKAVDILELSLLFSKYCGILFYQGPSIIASLPKEAHIFCPSRKADPQCVIGLYDLLHDYFVGDILYHVLAPF